MKVERAASIPLITHDPFFSIWSPADHLYDCDPCHWSGAKQQMRGVLSVDGTPFCFLGARKDMDVIKQTAVELTATATTYTFENEKVILRCRFISPVLADNLLLLSRPCTYIDFEVTRKSAESVSIQMECSADFVRQSSTDAVCGFSGTCRGFSYASMGRTVQQPLSGSADHATIDWGYLYLAGKSDSYRFAFNAGEETVSVHIPLEETDSAELVIAYDDLLSINYFGDWKRAYWTSQYGTILDAIQAAFEDKKDTLSKAAALDNAIEAKAASIGGDSYVFLCNLSYRQSIAAHKLILDNDGNTVFLSKENDSNGCIGTADVSYPSVPLFLMMNPELVKGMLRPIFRFAACDIWTFDFAPHDVGRYPYAWGQVYGLQKELNGSAYCKGAQSVYPPLYLYPANSGMYDSSRQMPVEECGNMLIMTAVVCMQEGSAAFARPYMKTLERWKEYLLRFGADPGEQLCTDDFAGHLAHNVNLSAKAILGIEAYSKILALSANEAESAACHILAAEMAKDWECRAKAGNHYALTFGQPESWSLKYNLVWDKLWRSHLFSEEVYQKETAFYLAKCNRFGPPLDSRAAYTKSDWIAWCAAMCENTFDREKMLRPMMNYQKETPTRVPFSDWYDTNTGKYEHFIARSVQGGIFMPMLFHEK